MPATTDSDKSPWWRYPHVWMVISGPLIVVVAAIFTAYIAIKGQDKVLNAEEVPEQASADRSLAPAQQARNHAATPLDVPLKRAP